MEDSLSGSGFSLLFEGTSAVYIGDPPRLQMVGDTTLAVWINTSLPAEFWHNIIVKGHAGTEVVLRVEGPDLERNPTEDPYIQFSAWDGADHGCQEVFPGEDIEAWAHYAGTYDSDDMMWRLYRNGELFAESETEDPVGAVAVDAPWAIGGVASAAEIYPSGRHYVGLIDDVRMYNFALTQEIQQIYNEVMSDVEPKASDNEALPTHFKLCQNYPNPFNPETQIAFEVAKSGNVQIDVYNIFGQLVTQLINEHKTPGHYTIKWNATDQNGGSVSDGLYWCKMVTDGYSQTIRMLLLK